LRIDSHHHFWRYSADDYGWIDHEKKLLQRDFLPDDLKAEIEANRVDGVISVQARQSIEETQALLSFAERHAWILGVVGWLPLSDSNVESVLDEFGQYRRLRAVRHVVQDEPDDRFLVRSEFIRGIAALKQHNIAYDLLVFPHQLPAAIELVAQFPEQTFVLDHIAKPRVERDKIDESWRDLFTRLASHQNVFCKFSGVITEVRDADWNIETVRPYWQIALEAFGPSRLMFGTDWPVCLLRGTYSQWVATVENLACSLSKSEQAMFWGGTAVNAYLLPRVVDL
jgi:L-fuconolactonase